jgi:hypothetical protein
MKSFVACLALATVAAGCTAHTKRAGYVGGGALVAGGALIALSAAGQDCTPLHHDDEWFNGTGCDIDKGVQTSMGLLAVIGGAALFLMAAAAPDAKEAPKPLAMDPTTAAIVATLPPVEPPTFDPRLRNFTLQASMVARTGQCVAVQAIAKRVEAIDFEYRHNGFLGDPLVVACLQN